MEKPYVKSTLNYRRDLFLKAKLYAAGSGKTLTQVINEALEEYIENHEEELKQKVSEMIK